MNRIRLQTATCLGLGIIVICFFGLTSSVYAAKSGKPTGYVSFYGSGETQERAPDMLVWTGKFRGQSVTDAKEGFLLYNVWDCTGEMVYQNQKVLFGGGVCTLTDRDGDKVNLRWEVDDPNSSPGPSKVKTKGTYLSGSGKYSGIQGGYKFECELIADTTHYICRIVGGEYQLP